MTKFHSWFYVYLLGKIQLNCEISYFLDLLGICKIY